MKASSPSSVLVVASVFNGSTRMDPWLVDDLVEGLRAHGADVDVLVHDAATPRPRGLTGTLGGARVFSVGPTADSSGPRRLLQHALAGLRYRVLGRTFVGAKTYDLVVFFSPAFLSGFYPSRLRRAGRARHVAFVLWDFFPVHQAEVGRLGRSPALPVLKWIERRAMAAADTICVMSPASARFLASYHPGLNCNVVIVPPWGGNADVNLNKPETAQSSPAPSTGPNQMGRDPRFTLVFGGQLTFGRGVETLLDAAKLLEDRGIPANIIIAGTGPDEARLRQQARELGLAQVEFLGRIPRPEYLELLSRAQAGLAVTVPNVSIPSFPSKIVDYFRMGVPAILCLERTSDVGPMIASTGAALSIEAGDNQGLADAVTELFTEWRDGRYAARQDAARRYYADELSSDVAAKRILALASGDAAKRLPMSRSR